MYTILSPGVFWSSDFSQLCSFRNFKEIIPTNPPLSFVFDDRFSWRPAGSSAAFIRHIRNVKIFLKWEKDTLRLIASISFSHDLVLVLLVILWPLQLVDFSYYRCLFCWGYSIKFSDVTGKAQTPLHGNVLRFLFVMNSSEPNQSICIKISKVPSAILIFSCHRSFPPLFIL